jgi:hypothetical protein
VEGMVVEGVAVEGVAVDVVAVEVVAVEGVAVDVRGGGGAECQMASSCAIGCAAMLRVHYYTVTKGGVSSAPKQGEEGCQKESPLAPLHGRAGWTLERSPPGQTRGGQCRGTRRWEGSRSNHRSAQMW